MPLSIPRTWGQWFSGSRAFSALKAGTPGGVNELLNTLPGMAGATAASFVLPVLARGLGANIRRLNPFASTEAEEITRELTPSVGEQYLIGKLGRMSERDKLRRYMTDPMYRAQVEAVLSQRAKAGDQMLASMQQTLQVPGEYTF